jgi:hypothetical protein
MLKDPQHMSPPAAAHAGPSAADLVCTKADALYRAATECCRQHRHYAMLVDRSLGIGEQRRAFRMVMVCDENLIDAANAYERAARDRTHQHEDWRRCANGLWLASREYARRHRAADSAGDDLTIMTAEKLGELALEYDLEASALLLLQQAADAYRKARPEAELFGHSDPRHTS